MAEEERYRLRIRYAKLGRLRFLSHLEIMRTVMRVVRRAQLPYAISQGFSPHMKAAFSTALPVGCCGLDEYLDVQLTEYVDPDVAFEALAAAAPESLPVLGCAYIGFDVPALTAGYPYMTYTALIEAPGCDDAVAATEHALMKLLIKGSVTVVRKGKEKSIVLSEKLACAPSVAPADEPGRALLSFATLTTETGALRADVFAGAVAQEASPELGVRLLTHVATFEKFSDTHGEGRPL